MINKLKLGETTTSKLYLGSTEINKAYIGDILVYDTTPDVEPNTVRLIFQNNGITTIENYVDTDQAYQIDYNGTVVATITFAKVFSTLYAYVYDGIIESGETPQILSSTGQSAEVSNETVGKKYTITRTGDKELTINRTSL